MDRTVFHMGGQKYRLLMKAIDGERNVFWIRNEDTHLMYHYYEGENEIVDVAYMKCMVKEEK